MAGSKLYEEILDLFRVPRTMEPVVNFFSGRRNPFYFSPGFPDFPEILIADVCLMSPFSMMIVIGFSL